ncbi:MAG: flagellar biosynthetic protein FliR [Gammaproteobacteria bacterium]
MVITTQQIVETVGAGLWPFARVTGLCMVAPVIGGRLVPMRVRVLLAVVLTLIVVPLSDQPAPEVIGLGAVLIAAREVAIGVAMGFVVQMIFDAMVIGGQTISMSMGLGFATMVDPQRGSVPVLSQFYVVISTLLFLAVNAHLALIGILVQSFELIPAGTSALGTTDAWALVGFGSRMFAAAMQMALPALAALLMVNLAFGVMSRAAPNLNLFAVGFPVTMILGFVILAAGIGNVAPALQAMMDDAFRLVAGLATGG